MKELIEMIEMLIGNMPQNNFIRMINEHCTIKPGDSEKEIEEKRQTMNILIVMRCRCFMEKVKMEQENDDFDRMVKELLKKKDQ